MEEPTWKHAVAAERRAARLVGGLGSTGSNAHLGIARSKDRLDPKPAAVFFEDIVDRAGIDFVLKNSVTDHKFAIETMIGGVAVFDYDNDGLLDIYFANGALIPDRQRSELTLDSLDKSDSVVLQPLVSQQR